MCKLVTITKLEGPNAEAEKLLRLQFEELKTQRDGCAGLTIDFNNRVKVYRELNDYDKVFQAVLKDLPTSKLISLHTRIGTSGGKNLENVHFFKPKDWYFAHNGFVPKYHNSPSVGTSFQTIWENQPTLIEKYSGDEEFTFDDQDMPVSFTSAMTDMVNCHGCYMSKRGYCRLHEGLVDEIRERETHYSKKNGKQLKHIDKYCDSYQFVENLPKVITEKSIIDYMATTQFNGMGLLINKNGTDAFMLIAKECFAITDHSSFAGFFSYKPELKADITATEKLCGVKVKQDKAVLSINIKPTEIVRGVYKLHLGKVAIK